MSSIPVWMWLLALALALLIFVLAPRKRRIPSVKLSPPLPPNIDEQDPYAPSDDAIRVAIRSARNPDDLLAVVELKDTSLLSKEAADEFIRRAEELRFIADDWRSVHVLASCDKDNPIVALAIKKGGNL